MKLPKEITEIIEKLEQAGFEGYAVGGCVRDIIREVEPNDFDITTNATPEQVEKVFKKSFKNNDFGTVTVITGSKKKNLEKVEITPYRTEQGYSDRRRPDRVRWSKSVEEDLKRRDFTVNAIALHSSGKVIDPHKGREDLKKGVIRAVGEPKQRFSEDALRMMRAVRFSATLDMSIEKETEEAIKENASFLQEISAERIRDEFLKIIMCDKAAEGVDSLRGTGLLQYFLPELLEGYKIAQSKHHIYDCYKHSVESLRYAAKKEFNMCVRMAALLHDVGKPRAKQGEGEKATFYNHEIIGAKMSSEILKRLKFKKEDLVKIVKLVRYHLFYYNVGEVSESSVRRLLKNVGRENIDELLQVRMADRIGSGVPKAEPYKLRHLRYLIDKVSLDPIDISMLGIDGEEIMDIMEISPGPVVGSVISILLSEVISDPKKNAKDTLVKRVESLKKESEESLREMAKKAKREISFFDTKRDEMTKKKYWVS